jgi:DNA-binding beta-propeller fold protein YncE
MGIHRARDAVRAVLRGIGLGGPLIVLAIAGCTSMAASTVKESPLNGPRVFGWGFAGPDAIAADGRHVWVANGAGSTVSELSSTGALVKVLSGSRYKFDDPIGIAAGGRHVWVANDVSGTVSELSSTGALVRVLSGSRYKFVTPIGIAAGGANVWVTNADQSVTGFPVS